MPDQNVDVSYDPNGNPVWTISDPEVEMTEAGKIIFHRKPANATWTFVRINGIPSDWSQGAQGANYQVDDPHDPLGSWAYTITINYDGTEVTGPELLAKADPPPIIMNE